MNSYYNTVSLPSWHDWHCSASSQASSLAAFSVNTGFSPPVCLPCPSHMPVAVSRMPTRAVFSARRSDSAPRLGWWRRASRGLMGSPRRQRRHVCMHACVLCAGCWTMTNSSPQLRERPPVFLHLRLHAVSRLNSVKLKTAKSAEKSKDFLIDFRVVQGGMDQSQQDFWRYLVDVLPLTPGASLYLRFRVLKKKGFHIMAGKQLQLIQKVLTSLFKWYFLWWENKTYKNYFKNVTIKTCRKIKSS